jgi:hypothetical protein
VAGPKFLLVMGVSEFQSLDASEALLPSRSRTRSFTADPVFPRAVASQRSISNTGVDGVRATRQISSVVEGLPKTVRAIAWKAQIRLCGRYRRLTAACKKRPLVIAAIALRHNAGGRRDSVSSCRGKYDADSVGTSNSMV